MHTSPGLKFFLGWPSFFFSTDFLLFRLENSFETEGLDRLSFYEPLIGGKEKNILFLVKLKL